jgi:glycosyltransferase involved in cell wall biosynthesis
MKILFIHPNMPGQYKYLAYACGAAGKHEVVFLTKHKTAKMDGVKRLTYEVPRAPSPHTHRYLLNAEMGVLQGQEVWRMCHTLKQEGFTPDIVVGHPGWGDGLFIKDVFPNTPCLFFFEFFYQPTGADVGFDPQDPLTADGYARLRMKNITNQACLEAADWGISPTWWQWSLHPEAYRPKISVLHDGLNTSVASPNPDVSYRLPDGSRSFTRADRVVTYIARNFEPYRGFPSFMQAAEILLKERPDLHIIAVGADDISYGKRAPKGTTYRQIWQEKVTLDEERIHFVGRVPYGDLIKIFQLSRAHMYLSYPFVLSWSALEAMACGAPMVSSDVKPVREVITHEEHGLLSDLFDPDAIAANVMRMLDDPELAAHCSKQARARVCERYDIEQLLPLHMKLIQQMAQGNVPAPITKQFAAHNPRVANALWTPETRNSSL